MAGKREKKREDPMAVWLSTMCRLLKGGALAAATAALGLLVCALLVSGGVVGEKLMGRGVLAICVVSSLAAWSGARCWLAWGWESSCSCCC